MIASPGRILITGVSRGIGHALAVEFANRGWGVVGTIKKGSPLDFSQFGRAARANITLVPLDLADIASCQAIGDAVNLPIDVLVNCAAVFGKGAFFAKDFDPIAFLETLKVNVVAPALVTKALRPLMDKGQRKLIVMMSTGNASLSGNTQGEMFSYRASKSALNQVVRNLAAEWGPHGYTAVALNPGWVKTEMGGPNAPLTPSQAAANIAGFIVNANQAVNGLFLNANGSPLPW